MNVTTIPLSRLSSQELAAWSDLQQGNPQLASPCFRPEFAQAVDAVRHDTEVAVLSENGKPVGFLPFHRSRWKVGLPLAGRLCDMQAVICPRGLDYNLAEIVRAAGLRSWKFERFVQTDVVKSDFVRVEHAAPYIDLSSGFDAYIDSRDNGHRLLKNYRKKVRGLERAAGPLRFEPHDTDPSILETCIRWKSEQYRRTNVPNIFKFGWVTRLLRTICRSHSAEFAPQVAVLYAGTTVAAIDVGMRSRTVWHPWFCAYNTHLQLHSPGIVHLIEMMRVAPSMGIRRIDLGAGGEAYKNRFESGYTHMVGGAVDIPKTLRASRQAWWQFRRQVRSSPLAAAARLPGRLLYRAHNWFEFQSGG